MKPITQTQFPDLKEHEVNNYNTIAKYWEFVVDAAKARIEKNIQKIIKNEGKEGDRFQNKVEKLNKENNELKMLVEFDGTSDVDVIKQISGYVGYVKFDRLNDDPAAAMFEVRPNEICKEIAKTSFYFVGR